MIEVKMIKDSLSLDGNRITPSSFCLHKDIQGCYDSETRVLTEQGFVCFQSLIEDYNNGLYIKVAYVNDEGEIDYTVPFDCIKYDYSGEMMHFVGDGVDIRVTPNHNMITIKDNQFLTENAEHFIPEGDKFFRIYSALIPEKPIYVSSNMVSKDVEYYEGTVYCVTVPFHKLIVERNGSVVVCGNSRRKRT